MHRASPVLAAVLLAPSAAHSLAADVAARNARIERLHGEAVALYQARRFGEALVRFSAARALLDDPTLTYNIGRCHQALGELKAARAAYRVVIADPAASADLRGRARGRVEIVDAALAARAAPPVTPTAQPFELPVDWALVGGGGAVAVAGAIVFFLGAADHAELEGSVRGERGNITRVRAQELDEDGLSKKIWGGGLLCVGLATAGVGLFMMFDEDSAPTSVTPTLDRPGLVFTMEF